MIVIVRKIRVEGLGSCFRALFALLIGKLLGDDEEKVKKKYGNPVVFLVIGASFNDVYKCLCEKIAEYFYCLLEWLGIFEQYLPPIRDGIIDYFYRPSPAPLLPNQTRQPQPETNGEIAANWCRE